MKAKPIFYLNGNDRRFEDQHTISLMTGEPMPRKWQDFFELTPEEKARWDASLKLDEEYRIAEAQGFPNGIPGGKTRGDILHYFTQQEEAHKRSMQESSFHGRSFIPNKTEIQNDNSVASSNTLTYGRGNEQPTFAFNQKLNTDSPYTGQNNLLTMNTGIKKEPAFDVKQAIRKIASRLESRLDDSEEQAEMSSGLMQSRQDDSAMNETMPNGMRSSLTQTFNQKHGNQFGFDLTKEDKLKQWEENLEKGDYVILGGEYDDGLVMSRKEFMARYGKEQSELYNPVWDSDYGKSSVDTMPNSMSEKEYIYPIQRPCADIKKAPYANVQKMPYVNKENERYNLNTFEKDDAYNWDYGSARELEKMHYQQYDGDFFIRGWSSDNQFFNNGYSEDSDSIYMFTTVGTDGDALVNGPAFVEDISAIMKEWGSDYDKWVETLTKEEEVAFELLTEVVQDVAGELVARAPSPYFRIGGAVVLAGLSIYQSAKAVEEEWYKHVRQKMEDDSCSQEEAEKRSIPWLMTLICLELASQGRKSWLENLLKEIETPISARIVIMQDWGKVIKDLTGSEPGVGATY